jgi:hypothetical protein
MPAVARPATGAIPAAKPTQPAARPASAARPAAQPPPAPAVDPADKRHPAERPAIKLAGPPPMIGQGRPGTGTTAAAKPAAGAPRPASPAPAPRPVAPKAPAPRPAAPKPPATAPAAQETIDPAFIKEMEAISARLDEMDYFELFRLPKTAPPRDIKEAYYRESRTYHPDRYSQVADEAVKEHVSAIFKRVTEAYVVLRDDKKRAKYVSDVSGPERAKKLRYTEASESEQKAEAKKALDEQVGMTPKGRESFKNAMKEFDAKRWDGAMRQLKMALMYEPANARYKEKFKEAEKEWEKSRPKDDFRIK